MSQWHARIAKYNKKIKYHNDGILENSPTCMLYVVYNKCVYPLLTINSNEYTYSNYV